jgi:ketosteroid isomerase-like protein
MTTASTATTTTTMTTRVARVRSRVGTSATGRGIVGKRRANDARKKMTSLRATATNLDAESTVREMYRRINARDVAGALECVDDDVVYEDFNFQQPFVGKEAVRRLFEESCDGIPDGLDFIVDECTGSSADGASVGMTWHVEMDGEAFPNARGCSFYRVSEKTGKLAYARDVVESPAKLGEASFSIIRVVAPLVKKQIAAKKAKSGGGANDVQTKSVGIERPIGVKDEPANALTSAFFWLAGAAYWYVLLLSPSDNPIPGDPAYAIKPETLQEVIASSTDFFFVLPILNKFGVDLLGQAPEVHPVSLGVFNFAEAYIFMLLPLLMMDKRGRDLPTTKMWSIGMFLTNAVLLPYMAIRANTPVEGWNPENSTDAEGWSESKLGSKGLMSKIFGATGLGVGLLSVYWTLFEDPSAGNLSERLAFFNNLMHTDRVSVAFVVDIALVCIWQAYFMKKIDKDSGALAYIPYWGLCLWLML